MIEGYQGIMPLDTSHMKPQFVKQAIEQHSKDIEGYKREQSLLKPEHRYENTIIHVQKQHKLEYKHRDIRNERVRLHQMRQDEQREKEYSNKCI
tara:strand:+ start:237 stop:518 length:282 start_codon:yes stop_codon:yes gene_type:complete